VLQVPVDFDVDDGHVLAATAGQGPGISNIHSAWRRVKVPLKYFKILWVGLRDEVAA
jgi:hypothetical protein